MSTRKRLFADFVRSQTTPYIAVTQQNVSGISKSKKSTALTPVDVNTAHPGSARGILRRLAKITAGNTKKRVATPAIAQDEKENEVLKDEIVEEDVPLRRPNFSIEESIEEDDSELPTAPTPSALLEESDEEDQPTGTFQNLDFVGIAQQRAQSEQPHPLDADSGLQDQESEEGEDSTMLTERGRRAVSEDRTRMSRYSFGSIRMSDFGSTLEVKRASGANIEPGSMSVLDGRGHDLATYEHEVLRNETEDLRALMPTSPQLDVEPDEVSVLQPPIEEETFQLDVSDVAEEEVHAPQLAHRDIEPVLVEADSHLGLDHDQAWEDDSDGEDAAEQTDPHHDVGEPSMRLGKPSLATVPASSRRQTLLEAVAAVAHKPTRRKRVKLNQHGYAVPSLPSSLIKRVVHDSQVKANKRKTALSKEHMAALEQATEWFFEQASEDLADYADHSKHKTRIGSDDVLLLMRRQRVLRQEGDLRKLAKDWLPREMLNELDLPDRPYITTL